MTCSGYLSYGKPSRPYHRVTQALRRPPPPAAPHVARSGHAIWHCAVSQQSATSKRCRLRFSAKRVAPWSAAVVVWLPVMIAAAAGIAWSLLSRVPDATLVAPTAERDMPLARKGDYLDPRLKPRPGFAARWVPLAPPVKMGGGPPNESLPSIEGPSPSADSPSSSASELARANATPHHQTRARHDHDVCAGRGMRREDSYQGNHWRSWRCVR